MYSPKIKEEFIPLIYRLAQIDNCHMTDIVNESIERMIDERQDDLKEYSAEYPLGSMTEPYEIETEKSLLEQDEYVFNSIINS